MLSWQSNSTYLLAKWPKVINFVRYFTLTSHGTSALYETFTYLLAYLLTTKTRTKTKLLKIMIKEKDYKIRVTSNFLQYITVQYNELLYKPPLHQTSRSLQNSKLRYIRSDFYHCEVASIAQILLKLQKCSRRIGKTIRKGGLSY